MIQSAATYLRTGDKQGFSTIHSAREIYDADGLERAELEARILAGQSNMEIGEQCRHSPQLIGIYHDLFLWVRPNLNTDWVTSNTIGIGPIRCIRHDELRKLWAWFAITGGPVAVDHVVAEFHRNFKPGDKPVVSVYLRKGADIQLNLQAAIAQQVIPVNKDSSAWFREFHLRQREISSIQDCDLALKAKEQLQMRMINVGRRALANKPLGRPKPQTSLQHFTNGVSKRKRASPQSSQSPRSNPGKAEKCRAKEVTG
ncbi:hypothetical protein [Calycomorphotria hydatis]|uniref:hypothetical protein n=1 Tax=Calycomorphotria hydatis TaxID=2528027 RepID=UPI0011A59E06|nr:hypothetical protein [Calycomorphotria hydatis]